MLIKIPPYSLDHIRQVVFRGSLPMPGSEVPWHHVRCKVRTVMDDLEVLISQSMGLG